MVLMILVGTRIIPRIMKTVAAWNSRELFLLATTAMGLGVGYGTYLFGLSFAFGAFVAGMVLSESDYGYQALSDIIPLRDIFSLLFFTSVGMLLDPRFLISHIWTILLLVGLVMAGKGLIFAVLARIFRYGNVVPLAMALGMSQVGEFSFVIARTGISANAISKEFYSLALAVTILTMFATPAVSGLTAPVYRVLSRRRKAHQLQTVHLPPAGLENHLVIAGGGDIGIYAAKVLKRMGISFVVLELNFRQFEQLKAAGLAAIYGDAGQEIILEAAWVEKARLMLITTPAGIISKTIAQKVARLHPGLAIVARSQGPQQAKDLMDNGVCHVIQPEFEAGLEFIRQALLRLDVPVERIQEFTDEAHRELYQPVYDAFPDYKTISRLKNASFMLDLKWVTLAENSPAADQSIGQMGIRTKTGATVAGIVRNGILYPNPDPEMILKSQDMVGVMGVGDQIRAFKEMVHPPAG